MKWKVEGADVATGKEKTVEVYGGDRAAAESVARTLGVLASVVTPIPEPIAYASSAGPAGPPTPVPAYADILRGHRWLGTIASVLTAAAYLSIVCAFVMAFAAIASVSAKPGSVAIASATAIAALFSCAVSALVLLTAAATLRFVGSVGLAVRDMAQSIQRS